MHRLLYILFLGLVSLTASAHHIVGGEMYYTCLGNNVYHITMNIYRDCDPNNPLVDYDANAAISIFNSSGHNIYQGQGPALEPINNIPPTPSNPCYTPPSNICVDQGVYEFDVTLPPSAGGYDVVYQRCCRNDTVRNIINPGMTGATYTVHIDPSQTACDNSPKFKDFPPIVICNLQPLVFDHSATDADGDSLVYSFCAPYRGASANNPIPNASAPPYANVTFQTPYNVANLVGGTPPMTIDPHTGIINANPNVAGRYSVGVQVQEYRNGVLIGTIRRDFQFNVTDCNRSVVAQVPLIDTSAAVSAGTDGIYKVACDSLGVSFDNTSINSSTYFWNFGDPNSTADTSNVKFPHYLYPAAGDYIVTLIANPGFFCADTTTVLVKAYPGFNTYYSYKAGCENVLAQFKDSTYTQYGFVNSWHWNFGDGSIDSAANTSHHYTDGGTYPVTLITTSDKGCKDTVMKQVVVDPIAKGTLTTGPPCLDLPIAISTNATIKSGTFAYSWNFGNGTSATINPTTATYHSLGSDSITLIMTSDKNCKDTLGKRFTIVTPPAVYAGRDTALCKNLPVPLSATGAVTYAWSPIAGLSDPNIGNPIATPADTTHYIVTGTDSVGCQGHDSVTIFIWPLPNTDAGADTYICQDSFRQLHGTGGIRFEWIPDHLMNNSHIADPVILADSNIYNITYYLTSYNSFNCQNEDSIHIAIQHYVVPSLFGTNVICRYDSVQLHAGGGLYYQWSPPDGLSSTIDSMPFASPSDSTTYTVAVSNDCFTDSAKFHIAVNQLPPVVATGVDTMLRDETDTVTATGALSYLWTPKGVVDSTGQSLLVSPFNTTTYVVTGTDVNGCKNKDSVVIYVDVRDLVLLPSAFTPDGNGVNDKFHIIRHLNMQTLLEFSIYSRWGARVFSTNDLNGGWDGTFEGHPMNKDVYTWVVRALDRDGKNVSQKGNVTLIR